MVATNFIPSLNAISPISARTTGRSTPPPTAGTALSVSSRSGSGFAPAVTISRAWRVSAAPTPSVGWSMPSAPARPCIRVTTASGRSFVTIAASLPMSLGPSTVSSVSSALNNLRHPPNQHVFMKQTLQSGVGIVRQRNRIEGFHCRRLAFNREELPKGEGVHVGKLNPPTGRSFGTYLSSPQGASRRRLLQFPVLPRRNTEERKGPARSSEQPWSFPPAPGIAVSTGLVTEDHNLSVLAINTHTLAVGEPRRGPGHTRNRREPVFTSDNRSV